MKISMILNVALGIALVFLCYLVTMGKGKEQEQEQEQGQDSSEVVINNILQRTSVRSYEDRPVEKEKIEKLLRAGMAAPTAVNKQLADRGTPGQCRVLQAAVALYCRYGQRSTAEPRRGQSQCRHGSQGSAGYRCLW